MSAPDEATGSRGEVEAIDSLAQEIRRVDGKHELGAAALAEALMPWVAAQRAEERERIAQAVEATYLGADFGRSYDGRESPDAALHHAYDEGLQDAARVARTEPNHG
jgi:hypothetical protein